MRKDRLSILVLVALLVVAPMPLAAIEAVPLPTSKPLAGNAPDTPLPSVSAASVTPAAKPQAETETRTEAEADTEIESDAEADSVPSVAQEKLPPNARTPASILEAVKSEADTASACEAELKALGVQFTPLDPIIAEGGCGIAYPVTLTALPGGVALSETATLSCPMAVGLAKWVKQTVAPLSKLYLQEPLTGIGISTSYQCRMRNGVTDAKLSEHAFANGLDVHFFEAGEAGRIPVIERNINYDKTASFQAAIRGAACAYFSTVLGPMTNAAHANHFHLDMRARNGGFRLCE